MRAGTAALVACDRAGCGRGLGGAPRWAEAQGILGRRSFEPDAFTYTTALRCLGRASRPDDVAALFEEAVARGLADDARVRDAAAWRIRARRPLRRSEGCPHRGHGRPRRVRTTTDGVAATLAAPLRRAE